MSINWTNIRDIIRHHSQKFVIATSGGVDSMLLLDSCVRGFRCNPNFAVAHFNHHIRDDSNEDAALVKSICAHHNIPFYYGETFDLKDGGNIEMRARTLRWAFLEQTAHNIGADAVLTGHHLNDYVENYLMGNIRGLHIRSCIMPQVHQKNGITRIKPFLHDLSKEKIYDIARHRKLQWREDSTNKDNDNLRNMVRNVIIPEMEKSHNVLKSIPNTIKSLLAENHQQENIVTTRKVVP